MTLFPHTTKKSPAATGLGGAALPLGATALLCLLLLLRAPQVAVKQVEQGLLLCSKAVIPALFPFMVFSEVIVATGVGERLLQPLQRLLHRLFKLPEAGCSAVVLGLLCGFPVGAISALRAKEKGSLTAHETEGVMLLSGNASAAFLLNVVGLKLWGNRLFGLSLYAILLLSQWIVGRSFLLADKTDPKEQEPVLPLTAEPRSAGMILTDAVRSACASMLLVCACVVFFSSLMGALGLVLERFGASASVTALLFCMLELTGGMNAAASLSSPLSAALLCALCAGWSGLSVHCQAISLCGNAGIRFRRYFAAKLLQGLLCALLFGVLVTLVPSLLIPTRQAASLTEETSPYSIATVSFLLCTALSAFGSLIQSVIPGK